MDDTFDKQRSESDNERQEGKKNNGDQTGKNQRKGQAGQQGQQRGKQKDEGAQSQQGGGNPDAQSQQGGQGRSQADGGKEQKSSSLKDRQSDLRKIEQWLPKVFLARTVLEVACGTGYWTQFIATSSASVVAVDSSLETLRVARTRVPHDKVHLLAGDAYSLPLSPATFDAGFAGFWWSHIPRSRISEFLHRFHAALVPGSKVVLLDNRFVAGISQAQGIIRFERTALHGRIEQADEVIDVRRQ